jgi:hypothetical protein
MTKLRKLWMNRQKIRIVTDCVYKDDARFFFANQIIVFNFGIVTQFRNPKCLIMKPLCRLLSVGAILMSAFVSSAFGQGSIISITPSMVYPGQTTDIIIRGMGTGFKANVSKVDFGSSIQVTRIVVENSETIDASVSVSKTAALGFADVKVVTGNSEVTRPNGLQIFVAGGKLTATIVVIPVQSLHLSDFDPNNLAHSPLLFSATVFNDATQRDLQVNLTVSGQSAGVIATAKKFFKPMAPNAVATFDNRQFDKYQVSNSNNPAIQTAIQTGTLPADVYDYHIQVYDIASGSLVADADGSNVISNVFNKPELISPGNPFNSDPVAVHTKTPVFQWFSQGNSYDFYLYEVKPGQRSQEEVALNRPYYFQKGISTSTIIYPASATMMEDGKVYAWQVIANYSGTTGVKPLASELFWFTMASSKLTNSNRTVAELKVEPDQVTLTAGQSMKFTVKAYDTNNDTLSVKPAWSVIPVDGGTIDNNGNFIASSTPNTVAVVAAYGDAKDYATVSISAGGGTDAWGMNMFLRELFGLPK